MPLGFRDTKKPPGDQPMREDRSVFQLADNGALIYSDRSDQLFRALLAQSLRAPETDAWASLLERFSGLSYATASRILADAANRWCDQQEAFLQRWQTLAGERPFLATGFVDAGLALCQRIRDTQDKLVTWGLQADLTKQHQADARPPKEDSADV